MLVSICSVFNRYIINIMQVIDKVYIKYCLKFVNCNFKNKQFLNINFLFFVDSFKSDNKLYLKIFLLILKNCLKIKMINYMKIKKKINKI